MGSMLRSDPMTFFYMYVQPEAAFDILSEFGEMGCVQFIDMNPDLHPFERYYIADVCRCDDMERRLRYLYGEMVKDDIFIPEIHSNPKAMKAHEMNIYENIFEKWEDDITAMTDNQARLMTSYCELAEMKYVLTYIGPMFGDADIGKDPMFPRGGGDNLGGRLFVNTGVIRRSKSFAFEMMLWRLSRGNIFYRQASDDKILEDPYTGKEIRKVAFLVVCQGEQLANRLHKVFTGFRVNIYSCPETQGERASMMGKLDDRLKDLNEVIVKTKYLKCKALRTVGKKWRVWITQVRKAKAIYHTMSQFNIDYTKKCLIGQCWIPNKDVPRVNRTLERISKTLGSSVHSFISKVDTILIPPTFHRTNTFTHAFQVLINAYGDSRYTELNPGLYTIITFPFLFSLMFGDCGHAIILICFGAWMIAKQKQFSEERTDNEIWKIFFGGRFIILLLGIFSFYAGFMYNDWFGKSLVLTKSYWKNSKTIAEINETNYVDIDPKGNLLKPYPFGLDPIWPLTSNKILMQNSIKMKLSIIIGVIHMIFGLCLSCINYIHFKNYYSIFFQFLPEFIFLCSLFLWLVILIYMKWFMYSAQHPNPQLNDNCAPQILLLFIDMVLLSKSQPVEEECEAYMFHRQRMVQMTLVFIGLLCVPILLLGSPLYIHFRNTRRVKQASKRINIDVRRESQFRRYQKEEKANESVMKLRELREPYKSSADEHCLSDLMIHQAVHTIEFVLSTISHTASYLRLWALSLAHSQLSDMLWEMILAKLALHDTSFVGIPKLFVIFSVWAAFTVSILVLMEGLSAFLHTLRLHWVEFMSKFYHGGGLIFNPLCFRTILEVEIEKPEAGCKKTKTKTTQKVKFDDV